MNELALFAGAGGGILGGCLLGWRTVCAVEIDPYAIGVLIARQNEGILPPFPIWDDVRTFDGMPWRGCVDVVSGGFPCQDISCAGKGAGINGEHSGLWSEMARIISEIRPRYVFMENSPMLIRRGLTSVLGDLAAMGYDARWGIIGAHHAGAPHKRDRIWIVANSNAIRELQPQGAEQELRRRTGDGGCNVSHTKKSRLERTITERDTCTGGCSAESGQRRRETDWWKVEPAVGRVANGVAARMDRLKAIGNGQVPAVAALAWWMLTEGLLQTTKRET